MVDPDTGETVIVWPTSALSLDIEAFHENACKHEKAELRRWITSNGAERCQLQCLFCGTSQKQSVKKQDAPKDTPKADRSLAGHYEEQRQLEYQAIGTKHLKIQTMQGREYDLYLKSSEWRIKREKVLGRANGICEGCLDQPATQVHHTTYDHLYDELLFELVALCEECHARCHSDKTS